MLRMLHEYEDKMRLLELELNNEKRVRVSTQRSLGQLAKYGSVCHYSRLSLAVMLTMVVTK